MTASNPVAEVLDTFFNGRPAPKQPKLIRVRLSQAQIQSLANGKPLQFLANGTLIVVSTATGGR